MKICATETELFHAYGENDGWAGSTDGHEEANSHFSQFLQTRLKLNILRHFCLFFMLPSTAAQPQ